MSKKLENQAYWTAVKQNQLGDTNVDPKSQTLVVEHVVDLQETEQHCIRHENHRREKIERTEKTGRNL